MATWDDIELVLDRIEQLDQATLEAFARVMPPPSQNPAFHQKFNQAQQRILRRLSQLDAEAIRRLELARPQSKIGSDDRWYKKPAGVVVLSVAGGVLLLAIRALLMRNFPQWFR